MYFKGCTPHWHLSSRIYTWMHLVIVHKTISNIPWYRVTWYPLSCLDTMNKGSFCLHGANIDSLYFNAVGYQLPTFEKHGDSHGVAPESRDKYVIYKHILRYMHTGCVLVCFTAVWSVFPSGLLHCHWENNMIAQYQWISPVDIDQHFTGMHYKYIL